MCMADSGDMVTILPECVDCPICPGCIRLKYCPSQICHRQRRDERVERHRISMGYEWDLYRKSEKQ